MEMIAYQACPSLVQLAHLGRAESHLSLRLRHTRQAVNRFLSSVGAAFGAVAVGGGGICVERGTADGDVVVATF